MAFYAKHHLLLNGKHVFPGEVCDMQLEESEKARLLRLKAIKEIEIANADLMPEMEPVAETTAEQTISEVIKGVEAAIAAEGENTKMSEQEDAEDVADTAPEIDVMDGISTEEKPANKPTRASKNGGKTK